VVDFEQLLPALSRAGVEVIVVGGVAAIVHGSARLYSVQVPRMPFGDALPGLGDVSRDRETRSRL